MNDIYPVGLTTERDHVDLRSLGEADSGMDEDGIVVRQYQGSSHYLTGGSIPPLSTSHMTKGGSKLERYI